MDTLGAKVTYYFEIQSLFFIPLKSVRWVARVNAGVTKNDDAIGEP